MGDKINNFVKSFDTKLSDLVKKQVESDNEYKRLRDIAINTRNSSGGTTVVNAGNNATSKPRTVGVRDAYTS